MMIYYLKVNTNKISKMNLTLSHNNNKIFHKYSLPNLYTVLPAPKNKNLSIKIKSKTKMMIMMMKFKANNKFNKKYNNSNRVNNSCNKKKI